MRLQKYMAICGVASRRKSEELIKENRVMVNDNLVTEMGYIVDENIDIVKVDNKIINNQDQKHYYAFNKPTKIITSSKDEKNRKSVIDFFSNINTRLFTVGRLDYDSSGLILVTNDGEFANRVTHPKYECLKTYDVIISGHVSKENLEQLKNGIVIDGYKTSPAIIELKQLSPNSQSMQIIIKEGRNRQIRKMIESVDAKVNALERIAIGPVKLESLEPGEYRKLSQPEVDYFYSLVPKKKSNI